MGQVAKMVAVHENKEHIVLKEARSKATGIPDYLKNHAEKRSGVSLDDVRVHYGSSKPAQVNALAYTRGSHIYIAPGQERHLKHELGHVIQQKTMNVRPTRKINGMWINDDEKLERQADDWESMAPASAVKNPMQTVQRMSIMEIGKKKRRKLLNEDGRRAFPFKMIEFADNHRDVQDIRWYDWNEATVRYVEQNRVGTATQELPLEPGKNYLLELDSWHQNRKNPKASIAVRFTPQELSQDVWFKLPVYATGDMFAAVAAALASPFVRIRIRYDAKKQAPMSILYFFKSALGGEFDGKNKNPDFYNILVKGVVKVCCKPQNSRGNQQQGSVLPINEATQYVGDYFDGKVREKMNENLRGKNGEDGLPKYQAPLRNWLTSRGFPNDNVLRQKKIYIIWMRFSGFNGGAHPEQDSSFKVVQQIIAGAHQDDIIVIAGDTKASKKEKMKRIINSAANKVIDLTEFWKDRNKVSAWGGDGRFEQIRVYAYLKEHAKSLRHIGTRSGNLEGMAFLGHQVRYMDHKGSIGGKRMDAYSRHDERAGVQDQIGYKKVQMNLPASFKGKYIVRCMYEVDQDTSLCNNIVSIAQSGKHVQKLEELLKRPEKLMVSDIRVILSNDNQHVLDENDKKIIRTIDLMARLKIEQGKDYSISKYPENIGTDIGKQRVLYILSMLAARHRKNRMEINAGRSRRREFQIQRGLSNEELHQILT